MTEQTQNVQLLESNEPCANIEPGLLSVFRLILAVMGSLQLVSLGYFLSQFWFNIPTPRIPISPWIFVLNAAGLFALNVLPAVASTTGSASCAKPIYLTLDSGHMGGGAGGVQAL